MSKYLCCVIIFICLTGSAYSSDNLLHATDTVADIYKKVESLKISWQGYTLGAQLNTSQKEIARKNLVTNSSSTKESSASGTYKFRDKELNIVADIKTDRVLILFESFDNASQQKARDIIGSLVVKFHDPTLSAHDKIVYWAYGEKGKYSSTQFEDAKENVKGKQEPLAIIATIKLQSEIPIMEELSVMEKGQDKDKTSGRVYYIISSERLLKQLSL